MITRLPNSVLANYGEKNLGIELGKEFDWIFDADKYPLNFSKNGCKTSTKGFGTLHQNLSQSVAEFRRIKFYAKLIAKLALEDRSQELKDLFAVLTAHETSSVFPINLASQLDVEVRRCKFPYPHDGFDRKIRNVVSDVVLRGPDRHCPFIKTFGKVFSDPVSRNFS